MTRRNVWMGRGSMILLAGGAPLAIAATLASAACGSSDPMVPCERRLRTIVVTAEPDAFDALREARVGLFAERANADCTLVERIAPPLCLPEGTPCSEEATEVWECLYCAEGTGNNPD